MLPGVTPEQATAVQAILQDVGLRRVRGEDRADGASAFATLREVLDAVGITAVDLSGAMIRSARTKDTEETVTEDTPNADALAESQPGRKRFWLFGRKRTERETAEEAPR